MISLAAWMTVSTSALSKLRTTNRPRWAAGTGGAVGGGGLGAIWGSSRGAGGGSGRGPTETGGNGGRASGSGVLGGAGVTATTGGSGVATGGPGFGRGDAQPEINATRVSAAASRFTLLLRRRRGLGGRLRWQAAAEARRGPSEGQIR